MSAADLTSKILAFALQVGEPHSDPAQIAQARMWLDSSLAPTAEGVRLVASLTEQEGTRSVFRIVQ